MAHQSQEKMTFSKKGAMLGLCSYLILIGIISIILIVG